MVIPDTHEEADLSPFDPNDSRGMHEESDHDHDGPGVSCAHQWYKMYQQQKFSVVIPHFCYI